MSHVSLSWKHANDPAVLICCGFGSGFLPKMPGTWGSAVALALWWLVLAPLALWLQLLVCVGVFVAGVFLIDALGRRYGTGDDPAIVIDEFVGLWIVLAGLPDGWPWVVAGFVAFRLFDMLKPWPISVVDARLHGGFGVMLDDLVAGLCALIVLRVAFLSIVQVT